MHIKKFKYNGTAGVVLTAITAILLTAILIQIPDQATATLSDFNFVAAADFGCTSNTPKTITNMVGKNPEIAFAMGDLSYKTTADCWFQETSSLDSIMKIAIGNEDVTNTTLLEQYLNHYEPHKRYYSFDYQNVHFTVFDTDLGYRGTDSTQVAWVKDDLSNAAANPNITWKVVIFHHPSAFTSLSTTVRDTFNPIFDQYGVDLVMFGHNHNYERGFPMKYNSQSHSNPIVTDTNQNTYTDPTGVLYVKVGTGGHSLNTLGTKLAYTAAQYQGYGTLDVSIINDGKTMVGKFYSNSGSVIDKFTVTKGTTSPPPGTAHATALTADIYSSSGSIIKSVPWGNTFTVKGKLTDTDSSGAGIAGKTITFAGTGGANIQPATTASDGTYSTTGTAPSTTGSWTWHAHFGGDSDFEASDSAIQSYTTTKHSVSLSVSISPTSVPWSRPTTFTATLTDSSASGKVISDKTIHFDGTGVIGVAGQNTGTDGKAVSGGTAPDTVATGWTYQAHFAGDSLYSAKDSSLRTYSTIKHATSLTLTLSPTTVAHNSSFTATGTLKDSSASVALDSKTITFTASSPITIADATTTSTGSYSAKSTAPPTSGSYTIQAHFAGDSQYSAKDSTTKTLTVT